MSLDALIMLTGAFIAILTWVGGFPAAWDRLIVIAAGMFVVALGIMVRRRGNRPVAHKPSRGEFVESVPEAAPPQDYRQTF